MFPPQNQTITLLLIVDALNVLEYKKSRWSVYIYTCKQKKRSICSKFIHEIDTLNILLKSAENYKRFL